MSQPINDGGPAFPRTVTIDEGFDSYREIKREGMSLRDWFAGQALAGMLADGKNSGRFADIASDAYDFADAMLAARKADQGPKPRLSRCHRLRPRECPPRIPRLRRRETDL